jgi:hypothetical protein
VERALPIDATLLSAVLLRLRRDVVDRKARWTLGTRGAMEMDVHFVPASAAPGVVGPAWTTTARLWDPAHLALVTATVELAATSADRCELRLVAGELTPWWQERTREFVQLANAALDELAEELLWHATRRDIATTEA